MVVMVKAQSHRNAAKGVNVTKDQLLGEERALCLLTRTNWILMDFGVIEQCYVVVLTAWKMIEEPEGTLPHL